MATLFDTHFHLTDQDDPTQLAAAARKAGVTRMLAAGAAHNKAEWLVEQIAPFPEIYAAAGVHPHEADQFDGQIELYRELCVNGARVQAVGEIGLDYYYDHSDRKVQQKVFSQFLELALDLKMPAIVHIRDAYDDAYSLLKDYAASWEPETQPFVVHCFSGAPAWAERFLDLGGMLSYTGLITFKSATEIRDALKVTPINRMMFETDSPYLAPIPYRGRRNQPAYVAHVLERAAKELETSCTKLAEVTTANANRFFHID